MTPELTPTFYVEQNGSPDFELLVVDQNVELAGVDARVGRLHRGDQQLPTVHGAPRVWLELVGHGVLSGEEIRATMIPTGAQLSCVWVASSHSPCTTQSACLCC